MERFSVWLRKQLKRKNWRPADLARAANLDSAVISNLMNDKRRPGESTSTAIARALEIPPEIVFRVAGLLPPADPEVDEELEYLFAQLAAIEKEQFKAMLRAVINLTRNSDADEGDRLFTSGKG